ncbi:hypothetical protein IAE55_30845 [Paenibacillus sp. S28]|nr:hypothetical protein [Paenibacillus sp. S28]
MTRPKLAEVPSRIASRLNGSRRFRLKLQADERGLRCMAGMPAIIRWIS